MTSPNLLFLSVNSLLLVLDQHAATFWSNRSFIEKEKKKTVLAIPQTELFFSYWNPINSVCAPLFLAGPTAAWMPDSKLYACSVSSLALEHFSLGHCLLNLWLFLATTLTEESPCLKNKQLVVMSSSEIMMPAHPYCLFETKTVLPPSENTHRKNGCI